MWFAVKTYYLSRPTGRATKRDEAFISGIAAVEERVVLFRARDMTAALRKGRREAAKYAKSTQNVNVYGQRVVVRVMDHVEVYESFDEPADGAELFSSMELVPATETPRAILARKVGRPTSLHESQMFIAGWITEMLREELGRTRF